MSIVHGLKLSHSMLIIKFGFQTVADIVANKGIEVKTLLEWSTQEIK